MNARPIIGPNTIVSRSEEPVSAQVDETVVMMSIEQGMYFGLEGSGSRIWALLEQPRKVDEICETLMQEFEVDADACRSQVLDLLQELAQAQLIRCHDNADGTTAAPDRS